MSDSGGDAACWLDRVCAACGGVITAGAAHECRRPVPSTHRESAEPVDEALR